MKNWILITVIDSRIDSEVFEQIKAKSIGYNAYLVKGKLLNIQSHFYGGYGISMRDVICTKIDPLTAEVLTELEVIN